MQVSGIAACPPRPVTVSSMVSAAAITGPGRIDTVPGCMAGQLCSPKMRSHSKRSNSPDSIIACAPPLPSSAG